MASEEAKHTEALIALEELAKQIVANPLLSGLAALLANQAAYKAGFYDPRKSPDGRTYSWVTEWGFKDGALHLGDRVWTEVDMEQVAAQNATMIGDMIMAATLLYAGKAPMVQPIIGVKA